MRIITPPRRMCRLAARALAALRSSAYPHGEKAACTIWWTVSVSFLVALAALQ